MRNMTSGAPSGKAIGMNIADRKRAKKAKRRAEDWERSEELRRNEMAQRAYEAFHQLPGGSCTLEQVRSSAAGIEGWAASAQRMTTIDILTKVASS